MLERRFPTTGTTVPPLLARKAIVDRIIGSLSKPNPDHLQVIGARLSGKTVLLKNISETLIEPRFHYTAVLQWDLGHQTPASDELFMKALAEELSTALKKQHPDYSDYLKKAPSNPYHEIAEVLDLLTGEDVKILAILDGLDSPRDLKQPATMVAPITT